jgi:hypothetical protein
MPHEPTTIAIAGKVVYQDEITVAQAARIIAFLNAQEVEAPAFSDPLVGPSKAEASPTKVGNPRDALEMSGARTNPEKIVALGAYVLQDGGETFKAEDVKTLFRRARETAPANFGRDLSAAVAAGWLAEDQPGEFYTTNRVQGIFKGDFTFPKGRTGSTTRSSANARATSGAKPSRARASRASGGRAKPESFKDIDEFPMTMDGFPSYARLKSRGDRLLWVLLFAKRHGIAGLAARDVDWLTDHQGEAVQAKHVGVVFDRAKAAGHANRSTNDGTMRITPEGETHLASLALTEA